MMKDGTEIAQRLLPPQADSDAQYILYILVVGGLLAWVAWLRWGQRKPRQDRICAVHSSEIASMKKDIEHLQEGQVRIEGEVLAQSGKMDKLADSVSALAVKVEAIKGEILLEIQRLVQR